MSKATILIVDDEEDIRELVELYMTREGYDTLTSETGEEALELIDQRPPDLVILDLMLPGIDGLEVCRKLKANRKTAAIPILMVTARAETADVVLGLELGAEDYVTKPFSGRVLVARVRRILKRQAGIPEEANVLDIHGLTIDMDRREVCIQGRPLQLTFTEFNILHTLAKRPGIVFSRYQIVDAIHGSDHLVTDRAIDVQMVSLRKKLGTYGRYIETVRGVGYRFKDQNDVPA